MRALQVAGETINYKVMGTGKPLVLLHGFGGSHVDWDGVAANLKQSGFEVIIPNLTALYMKADRQISFSQQAHLLRSFLELLVDRTGKVSIAGVSYGGALGWAVSLLAPDLVEKLVLVNPMPPAPKRKFKDGIVKVFMSAGKHPKAFGLFVKTPVGRTMLSHLERLFRFPYLNSKPSSKGVAHLTPRKLKIIYHILHTFSWIIANENWSYWEEKLSEVKTPILFLWGDKDKLFDRTVYFEMDQAFPDCQLTNISNGKHMMIKDQADEVSKIMQDFLMPLHLVIGRS